MKKIQKTVIKVSAMCRKGKHPAVGEYLLRSLRQENGINKPYGQLYKSRRYGVPDKDIPVSVHEESDEKGGM